MHYCRRLCLGALLLAAAAAPGEAPFRMDGAGPWDVTLSLEYAPETQSGVRPHSATFRPMEERPNFGLVSGAYWFRLRLKNNTTDTRWVLEATNPRLGLVELYAPRHEAHVRIARAGDTVPLTGEALSRRPPAFDIRLQPGDEAVYHFRIAHHGALHFGMLLWPHQLYRRQHAAYNVATGILCGAIAIMLLYNLLLTLQIRSRSYCYFTLFILFYLLYIIALEGLGNEYLWNKSQWWAVRGIIFLFGMAALFLHAFARAFLETPARAPRWDKILIAGMGASIVVVLGSLTYSLLISALAHLIAILAPVYMLSAALRCWRGGYRPAGIFFLAWSLLMASAAGFALVNLGYASDSAYALDIVHFGFAATLAVFSIAMDTRARLSAAALSAQLESQVAERTRDLREALDNVQTLRGMIPICSHCKKIRDDEGYWNQIETYLNTLGDITLTHGVCPQCAQEHYPDFAKRP
jgi:two-component system, sensor histidine kinase LadS